MTIQHVDGLLWCVCFFQNFSFMSFKLYVILMLGYCDCLCDVLCMLSIYGYLILLLMKTTYASSTCQPQPKQQQQQQQCHSRDAAVDDSTGTTDADDDHFHAEPESE